MSTVSHQTIKLSRGKHTSPGDGACVMELASMLAGEPFGDHPECVCPAIGSFLRAYNDSLDDDRRQDLYEYASRVVGTRGSAELKRIRAARILAWAQARESRPLTRLLTSRLRAIQRSPSTEAAGAHAVRTIRRHTDQTHAAALALLDQLIGVEGPEEQLAPAPLLRDARRSPEVLDLI